ncbi:hypothetical protein [Cellulosimicrobium cellulans]|uniref:hypothetical protein n=1 Tax=Cellulosimicrobium cellulans TaxID=1710 RepID=UPI0024068378|nr:hypothetical protein [Cellulosimicrobium cellulans]MDF9874807.1 hypothetical protein [Cellulosimicrobium cellulans]
MEGYTLEHADRAPTRRELAPGLFADLPMRVTALDVDGYDVAFELDATSEGVRPVEVRVRAREGASPVSGGVMRALRIAELSQGALEYVIHADGGGVLPGLPEPELVREARDVGPTDRVLEQVALSYRVAQLVGHPTSKYIQARFSDAPKSTVGNWVRLARERGFLEPVEAGRGDG